MENEYREKKAFVGFPRNNDYDYEINSLMQVVSPWVAMHVNDEYVYALEHGLGDASVYSIRDQTGSALVTGPSGKHTLDTTTWVCDCKFATTMKLPCRHVFAYRVSRKLHPVVPLVDIHDRWKRYAPLPNLPVPGVFMWRRRKNRIVH
jgi:hypothetical protein